MKKTLIIIGIIFFIAIFKLFPNYSQIKELKEENNQYIEKIAEMEKEIKTLNHDLDNFKTDPFYLEKIARNELGMANDNEVIVHVE